MPTSRWRRRSTPSFDARWIGNLARGAGAGERVRGAREGGVVGRDLGHGERRVGEHAGGERAEVDDRPERAGDDDDDASDDRLPQGDAVAHGGRL